MPDLTIAGYTAEQHAVSAALAHRLHGGATEVVLHRLNTERDDEVYRTVVRHLGFDPLEDVTS